MFFKPVQYNKIEAEQLNWLAFLGQCASTTILSIWFKFHFRSYRVLGKEKIPPKPLNYVVACNHVSSEDPPIVSVALRFRPISYMAKQELFKGFLKCLYYRWMGTFSVNRDKLELSTIKSAMVVLKQPGWLLGIFPEGTRSQTGDVGETKKGVAYIAHTAKVGILPMGIAQKGETKKDVVAVVGDFIPYDPNASLKDVSAKVQQSLVNAVQQAMQANQ